MNSFSEIAAGIFRLEVPFEGVYTTVFLLKTPEGCALFDTATYPEDADNYILPALQGLGVPADSIRYIVLSHSHGDHSGGLNRLLDFLPDACIVSRSEDLRAQYAGRSFLLPEDEQTLLGCLTVIAIPGHAPDCLGLLDARTRTFLTGDSLQMAGLYGRGDWGANITQIRDHFIAIDRLRTIDINTLVASHDYHPFGYIAHGSEEISRYLDECIAALRFIRDFIADCPELDDSAAAELYTRTTGLPTIGARVVRAVRAAVKEEIL